MKMKIMFSMTIWLSIKEKMKQEDAIIIRNTYHDAPNRKRHVPDLGDTLCHISPIVSYMRRPRNVYSFTYICMFTTQLFFMKKQTHHHDANNGSFSTQKAP